MSHPLYVVATDLSRPSRDALSQASALARCTGASLELYCAVPANLAAGDGDVLGRVRAGVADVVKSCEAEGLSATSEIAVVREVAESIVEHAQSRNADLIAVGPSGVSGWRKWVLGSVTERVMRLAPALLLVAHGSSREPPRHVLAALDRTDGAEQALRTAVDVARATGAKLTALHVVPPPGAILLPAGEAFVALSAEVEAERVANAREEFETWVRQEPHDGLDLDVRVVQGSPAETVIEECKTLAADLVVLGTHGRSAIHSFFVGSVARAVATGAPVSVLLVRAPSRRHARQSLASADAQK